VGARGVGVDMLLPEGWGGSPAFSDLVLRHADSLVLAAYSPAGHPVIGPEAIGGLTAAALGPTRAAELFGFVDMEEDRDRVIRRARVFWRDLAGRPRNSFAARAAAILRPPEPPREESVWIDATIDWRGIERVSWRDLAFRLKERPQLFRDRFVLVGADFAASGDGGYRVPHPAGSPAEVTGPVLHAMILQTLLDGAPIRQAEWGWVMPLLACWTALCAVAILLAPRGVAVAGGAAAILLWAAAAFALFAAGRWLVPVAAPLATLLSAASLAAGGRLARQLARGEDSTTFRGDL
jgi:CHASE2 domain-containing sensor protein